MSPDGNTLIALGLVQRPRGLSGELLVRPFQPDSGSFRRGLPVVIKTDKTSLNTTIEYVKQAGRRDETRGSVVFGDISYRFTDSAVVWHGFAPCDQSEPVNYPINRDQ